MVADEGDDSVFLEAQRLQLVQQLPDVVIPAPKIPRLYHVLRCLNARASVDSNNLCPENTENCRENSQGGMGEKDERSLGRPVEGTA